MAEMIVIHDDRNVVRTNCQRCHGAGFVVVVSNVPGYEDMVAFTHSCPSCMGSGCITSTRGVSLPPLIPVAGKRKGGVA